MIPGILRRRPSRGAVRAVCALTIRACSFSLKCPASPNFRDVFAIVASEGWAIGRLTWGARGRVTVESVVNCAGQEWYAIVKRIFWRNNGCAQVAQGAAGGERTLMECSR
jgi:hypothetical protein